MARAVTSAGRRSVDATSVASIAVLVLAAWIVLVSWDAHGTSFSVAVSAWTAMMVAMMLPSAAPFVLLYRRGSALPATGRLVAGYLGVWALTGVLVWALGDAAMATPAWVVLGAAGVYQLTPVKQACLRRCRSAADFLVQYWHPSALRLGVHHGLYCLGCCWALMAVLVVAGMMSMVWVVAIAALVAAEKLLPRGEVIAQVTGVGLLALAVWKATTWM